MSPAATITFQLKRRQHADLTITGMLGNTAAVLADETLPQGTYSIPWNAGSMPQGIYFCRLRAGSNLITRKMVLLK